jgi:hypothetical protein
MADPRLILAPLGGEDNIRMMCDAENFVYPGFGDFSWVEFRIQNRVIVLRYFDYSFGKFWFLEVWNEPEKLHRSFGRGSIPENRLEYVFKVATGYSLSF